MKTKLLFWVPTALLSLMMLFSVYAYFTNPDVAVGFKAMGYPDFFRIELGIAKIIGVVVLLLPAFPKMIKEWAYAGFAITFISAFITHQAIGDASGSVMPLVALVLLVVSRVFYGKGLVTT